MKLVADDINCTATLWVDISSMKQCEELILDSYIESILRGCTKSARPAPLQHARQSCQGFL